MCVCVCVCVCVSLCVYVGVFVKGDVYVCYVVFLFYLDSITEH